MKEFPSLGNLYEKFKKNPDIAFLFISSESEKSLKKFIDKRKISHLPIYLLTQNELDLGWQYLPTTFVVEKDGRQAYRYIGLFVWDSEEMIKGLEKLIAEKN